MEESPEPAAGSSRRVLVLLVPFTALFERHLLRLPVGPPPADRRDFRWVGLSIDVEVPRDKPPGRSAQLPIHPQYRWAPRQVVHHTTLLERAAAAPAGRAALTLVAGAGAALKQTLLALRGPAVGRTRRPWAATLQVL